MKSYSYGMMQCTMNIIANHFEELENESIN